MTDRWWRASRWIVGVVVASTAGCATVATIQSAGPKTAKVFSGTRLDLLAIADADRRTAKFPTAPPPLPWLDLPFSFCLDVAILPMTLGAELSFRW